MQDTETFIIEKVIKNSIDDITSTFEFDTGEEDDMMEHAQLGLDKVRVKKEHLLSALVRNLEKHQKEFKETHEAWKKDAIEKMEENLSAARDGEDVVLYIQLEEPVDHTGEYEHVISLLRASIDDVIVLSSHEFRQYHDDQWDWSGHHRTAMANYSGKH